MQFYTAPLKTCISADTQNLKYERHQHEDPMFTFIQMNTLCYMRSLTLFEVDILKNIANIYYLSL